MAKLYEKERDALESKDFALSGRRYPIHDETHARDALARVSENGSPEEIAEVRRKVHARYPNMEVSGVSHGRGKAAKNKTPAEAYRHNPSKEAKRSEKRGAAPKKKAMSSGDRFIKHFKG